ncbi:chromate resistance protein ChrB domain-containing protein [Leptolyngbya sp. FACHB-36]|uniref:chromate resistance protein ChrB domain-containing protein n=1 Tax=Leptolyngbya sp. FACHB-36 TaxID=2692808 RepID=UPI001A7E680D|nr:chromate resistance protein ChrB domain-containing protein [Leptolyngbya sp. FACHB-36]
MWRRLRRIGAIALSGVQVLPDRDDCLESFQWLAREVRQANGEALVMRVEQFEGMSHQSIVNKFREVRREDYTELETKIAELEKALGVVDEMSDRAPIQETLEKLYKHHAEIRQIDFFDCPEQREVAARLKQLTQALLPQSPVVTIAPQEIEHYRNAQWVTRPQPHVDRLACIWLIRRFINPKAVIHYRKKPVAHEIPFDMHIGEFQHQGNLCTFEVMIKAFDLDDADLQTIGEIVHEIDLRDGLYVHPQIAGVDALLRGWLLAGFADSALEAHGIALFEGLYVACMQDASKATV